MRKSLACLAALAALILSVGTGIQPAGALPVADLSSTTTASTDLVSPVGGLVYYSVTFSNVGAPVTAQLRNATTGDGKFVKSLSSIPATCSAPADGTNNPVVNCDQALFAGTTSLKVVIKADVAGTVTSTSTSAIDPSAVGTVVEDDQSNNTTFAETAVRNDPNISKALVPMGQFLSFRNSKAFNVSNSKGIGIIMKEAFGGGDVCGSTICANGLHLDYDPHADHQGDVFVEVRLASDPCRGLGATKCKALYERTVINGVKTIRAVELCLGAESKPTCFDEAPAKEGRDFVFRVRTTSTDPDLLPPGTLTLN